MYSFISKLLPKTLWLFPVSPETQDPAPRKQQGIAMMIAVMIISIMMMFASDFIVSSSVDVTKAAAQRDNIRAEYIAKSGMNWALWLNLFDYGLQLQLGSDPAMKTMRDAIGPLWDKLGIVFPFDSPLDLSEADKFAALMGLTGLADANVVQILKLLGGELGVSVVDETGKINLNVCYQSQADCNVIVMQLEALMNCTAVEKDYNRQNNIKPSELALRIKDWIDKNSVAEAGSGFSDENEPYEKRKPSFKSKNSPLDSVDELLMVEGWTHELHAYYSPYLTVWPFPDITSRNEFKLNINTMPQEGLRCMFGRELGSPDAMAKFVKRYKELMETSGRLASSDAELKSLLGDLFNYRVDGGAKGDSSDRGAWLTTESRAFKIKTKGIVGDQTRILEYVIERTTPNQLAATPTRGPWSLSFFRMY
jgi:type II secretory pathway component PulK